MKGFCFFQCVFTNSLRVFLSTVPSVKTRIGRVVDQIIEWINEFLQKDRITYKDPSQGSKDHLKITLYPVDYNEDLKNTFLNLKLNMEHVQKIIPKSSIEKLDPERRLDQSLLFSMIQQS